jgi:hypothetical protein
MDTRARLTPTDRRRRRQNMPCERCHQPGRARWYADWLGHLCVFCRDEVEAFDTADPYVMLELSRVE